MPIEVEGEVRVISREQFYQIDERVVGIVFGVHNEFGRLLGERLYQEEIAVRCREAGMRIDRELRIRVSFEDFVKEYFVDLLANFGGPFETKAVEDLINEHDAQLLNYLFLLGLNHGSLINVRSPSVERRFISTSLTPKTRKQFDVQMLAWREPTPAFGRLKETMTALLTDWGAFLDFRLYREALVHFLGGPESVIRDQPVFSGTRLVGRQKVHMLDDEFAFTLTATKSGKNMATHLKRFLEHTRLRGVAWVNLNRHVVEFTTISSG